ncbi:MAG: class I SAM-dependent methyltransferase [Bacteroidota bacterium]
MVQNKMKNAEEMNGGTTLTEVRSSEFYKEQYSHGLVEKWDDLIDWEARSKGEGRFFIDELKKRGKHRVLDVAAGTGFHSILLAREGFEVWSADGSAEMLAKAFENGQKYDLILQTIKTDWRWMNKDIHTKFDAVICLGNSFTHLFDENDRRKALAEFYSVLKHDGILILDQRNYDAILDSGFSTKHTYYYAGKNVKAEPEYTDDGLILFKYEFPDSSTYNLNMFPLRKEYTRKLMMEVGFQKIETYGDFKETYKREDPDFYIHIAEKGYQNPDEEE